MNIKFNRLSESEIKKGDFKPHLYLNNVALSFFEDDKDFVADKIFPIVPVRTSVAKYHIFGKDDISRNYVEPKPSGGHVAPAVIAESEDSYHCRPVQIILPIDKLDETDFTGAGSYNPYDAYMRIAVQQIRMYMDITFGKKFFVPSPWGSNVITGVASSPSANQFIKFDADDSDPFKVIQNAMVKMKLAGRRKANVLALGVNVFSTLTNHRLIVDRVKYSGTTLNPAIVNENTLAQVFGLEKVVVIGSEYNDGNVLKVNKKFTSNANDALLVYAPGSPSVYEPSAGYIFCWDILGGTQPMQFQRAEGDKLDHCDFIEGITAFDMKVTSKDLGLYLSGCVSSN